MVDRALLVGINEYPGQPLRGCVNDVMDMAKFLVEKCNFASDDIRLLVDARATTDGIRDRLGWLLTGLSPNDRILFHYSGHGAIFSRRNSQGQVIDKQDTICPVDFDWSRDHAILASDFQKMFATIPSGTHFVFVSDSCNSGDLARAMRQFAPKFMVPPADMAWRVATAEQKQIPLKTMRSIAHDNCAFISGCRSDQESADASFGGRPNGALTYYLLSILKSQDYLKQALTKVVPAVVQVLQENNYDQKPQLHGPDALIALPFLGGLKSGVVHQRRIAVSFERGKKASAVGTRRIARKKKRRMAG
jgi:metacaspase-1